MRKKETAKLKLSKVTIATLNENTLEKVQGGATTICSGGPSACDSLCHNQ